MTDDYLFQDEKPTVKDGCEGCCFWENGDGDIPFCRIMDCICKELNIKTFYPSGVEKMVEV